MMAYQAKILQQDHTSKTISLPTSLLNAQSLIGYPYFSKQESLSGVQAFLFCFHLFLSLLQVFMPNYQSLCCFGLSHSQFICFFIFDHYLNFGVIDESSSTLRLIGLTVFLVQAFSLMKLEII